MNREEVAGKAETIKGKAKQAAGHLTNNPTLYDEGVADEAEGKTRDSLGRARRKIGKAIENVGKSIKK